MRYRLGILGGGTMGQAIARGALAAHVLGRQQIAVAEIDPARRAALEHLQIAVVDDPRAIASECEQLLIAVKPQSFTDLAKSIAPLAQPTIVITIMAGLRSSIIRDQIGDSARMIRVMPNTPCQLGEGMTGIALGEGAQPGDEKLTRDIFEALGRTVMLDESLMHAVTAVSGSGPAYVYLLAELMQKAATSLGLDDATAQLLVVQTIIGAGRMLRETGMEPEELRRLVTTPGGTTAAAVKVMEQHHLTRTMIDALTAARDRGAELDEEMTRRLRAE